MLLSPASPEPSSRPGHPTEPRPGSGAVHPRPRLAATLADQLRRLQGHRVRLMLTNAVGTDQAHTDFPTGRVVAVEADYVALDEVAIPGLAPGTIGVLAIGLARVVALAPAGTGECTAGGSTGGPAAEPVDRVAPAARGMDEAAAIRHRTGSGQGATATAGAEPSGVGAQGATATAGVGPSGVGAQGATVSAGPGPCGVGGQGATATGGVGPSGVGGQGATATAGAGPSGVGGPPGGGAASLSS